MIWRDFYSCPLFSPMSILIFQSAHTQEFISRLSIFPQTRELFLCEEGLKVRTGFLARNHFSQVVKSRITVLFQGSQMTLFFKALYPWWGMNLSLYLSEEGRWWISWFTLIVSVSSLLFSLFQRCWLISLHFSSLHASFPSLRPSFPHLPKEMNLALLCHSCEVCLALFVSFEWNWMMYLPFLSLSLSLTHQKWIHFSLWSHITDFLFLIHSFVHSFTSFTFIFFKSPSKPKKDCFREKRLFSPTIFHTFLWTGFLLL